MNNTRSSSPDLIGGNTWRCLLQMALPLFAAMLLTMAYNLVDSLWVGNLMGETGYAALTSSTAVVLILSAIGMGASNGAAILISQTVGAGRQRDAEAVIATMLAAAAGVSLVVTLALELFLPALLGRMGTPEALLPMARSYLSVYLLGYPSIFLYLHATAAFRSFGDPVFQMKGMLLSTLFNAVADPIMIHWRGLSGAAWATVFSELLCLGFAVVYARKKRLFHVRLHTVSVRYLRPLLADAVPSALQSCMPAISSAAMLWLVTGFGVTAIAAYGVTNKLEVLLFYPAMAMNMALTTVIGQCAGAGALRRVGDYLKCALALGGGFIAAASLLVIVFARPLTGLFLPGAAAADIVQRFFSIVSVGYVLYMFTSCFLGELSGLGKPGLSMVLMAVYYLVIRIPLAAVLVGTPLALNGIWAAILVSHVAAALLAAALGLFALKKHCQKAVRPA